LVFFQNYSEVVAAQELFCATVWLVAWEDELTTLPSTTSSTMVTTLRVVVLELLLEVETLQRQKHIQ